MLSVPCPCGCQSPILRDNVYARTKRSLYGLDMAKPVPGESRENPLHVTPVMEDIELTDAQVDALIALDPELRGLVIDQEGNSISPNE